MSRARSICIEQGCAEFVTEAGRCAQHRLAHTWDSSTHRKPRGWDRVRKKVLKRDRYRCQVCGGSGRTVDHLRAQAFGGNDQLGNLRTLCGRCHNAKTQDEAQLGRAMKGWPRNEREVEIQLLIARWS